MRSWKLAAVLALALASSPARGQTAAPTITYPAGSYTLSFPSPVNIVTTANSITFSWGNGPTPAPAPVPPAPVPVPAPVPQLTGHVWAIALYDASKPVPPVASSATLKAALLDPAMDADWLPHASTDPAVVSWIPHVPTTGLPALLLVQRDATGVGKLMHAVPLPSSEADVIALMSKTRGK